MYLCSRKGFSDLMRKIWSIVWGLLLVLPMAILADDLCVEGILLFREDFGGNDPSDPAVSMASVPGMDPSYRNSGNSLGSGNYTIRKEGWHNGIQWHWQDDHTYFNDKTRGYLLEIDGVGGAKPFYNRKIDGVWPGAVLSFSAYVVNVHYAGQLDYFGSSYVYPRLKFVIKDANTGMELGAQSTGDIQPDWRYGTPETWAYARENQLSAEWQLVGMNFTVPQGVTSLQLYIYNDVAQNGNGNDFALDDIELHMCMPSPTIVAPDTVCIDTKNILHADIDEETYDTNWNFQWYYSADSLTWEAVSNGNSQDLKLKAKPSHTGWYQVAVFTSDNLTCEECRVKSEPHWFYVIEDCPPILCADGLLLFREDFGGNDPNDPEIISDVALARAVVPGMSTNYAVCTSRTSGISSGSFLVTKQGYQNGVGTSQWHLQDDHTYLNDITRGYFIEIDGKGDHAAFYSTTIENLCAGTDLSFIAHVANVMTWGMYVGRPGVYAYPRLLFRLTNPENGEELAAYDTGEIPFDSTFINDNTCWQKSSQWHRVGMNFTVPENINSVTLTIYNNATGTIGNDFALDDIEIRLCLEPVTISGANPACRKQRHTMWAEYDNYGTIINPEYQWYFSTDSAGTYEPLENATQAFYTIPTVHKSHEGWYRAAVAETGSIDNKNCRSISEPYHLLTKYCETAVTQLIDTTACDTLMPITWRGHEWSESGSVIDTLKDFEDDDSVYVHLSLNKKICCPDIRFFRIDSITCDTLMPLLWIFRDTMFLFENPGEQAIEYPHHKWENCIGDVYILSLDTVHCERLYDLIVSKYNWQLVLNNVALRKFFPDLSAVEYQWYKNGEKIEGATEDDYSEQNELQGSFQLRLVMNDGLRVWSNILEIGESQPVQPVTKRIFTLQGREVTEERMTRGIYLIRYEQGDKVWTEKKLIP